MGDYFKTINYSQQSLVASLDKALNGAKESVVSRGWGPLVVLARTTIISLMEKITRGQLRVLTQDGIYTFGNPSVYPSSSPSTHPTSSAGAPTTSSSSSSLATLDASPPTTDVESDAVPLSAGTTKQADPNELRAELRVVNDAFWVRMFILSDLGFAEAYLVGDVEVDDLDSVFKMFILNRSNLSEMSMTSSSIFSAINSLMNSRFVNSVSNSISNISAHYDISNRMFASFLSRDMTYSCAYFPDRLGGIDGDLRPGAKPVLDDDQEGKGQPRDELEEAQYEKLRLIIRKAKIGPGDRVLEIGSGWGSFSIEAVRSTGCTVDTITLSVEQQQLARQRVAEAGLEASVRVHLMDYRRMPKEFEGAFDRVVSIEMIEAVGLEYLETYFEVVEKMLKPGRGIGVFQVITMPEGRFDRYRKEVDFINKFIFPGGVLPSLTFMVNAITNGSKKRLIVDSIENIGPHYARTLREWQRRFETNFETEIVPALKETYPQLRVDGRKDIETFRRKWNYYFAYCSTGFSLRVLGDHIFTCTREGNLSLY